MTRIPPEIFAIISAGSLASIQLRRVIKGELPLFGLRQLSAASKIKIDTFDKSMIVIAGISFVTFLLLRFS